MQTPTNLSSGTGDQLSPFIPESLPDFGHGQQEQFNYSVEWEIAAPHTGTAAAEHRARMLIVGGLGHLGETAIQPALEAMPGIIADCLDFHSYPHPQA